MHLTLSAKGDHRGERKGRRHRDGKRRHRGYGQSWIGCGGNGDRGNEGSGCDRRHRCDGGSVVVGDQSAKGDPRKARQEDKTQAVGKEADRPEGFCHGPKDRAKEGRRKEAGYEIDAQDGQGPQIRAGKAAGGEAQTQNCCATSIQTDEALERSLTRFLAGLGSCRVF